MEVVLATLIPEFTGTVAVSTAGLVNTATELTVHGERLRPADLWTDPVRWNGEGAWSPGR